ncbi:MAG: amidohydrolase family protein [Calditrichaeota bacterium]|nr:amidohydrolase family protein [Calditrichota bacterium]
MNSEQKRNPRLFTNGRIFTSRGLETADIWIEGGKITQITPPQNGAVSGFAEDLGGQIVLPGFVDVHTNGAAGFDTTWGLYHPQTDRFDSSESAYFEGLERAARFFLSQGVTTAILTTISAPLEQIRRVLKQFARFKATHSLGAVFKGIFIEGTFIASPAFAGAHNPEFFQTPTRDLIRHLQEDAEGHIRLVNIPPEHGEKVWDLIPILRELGILTVAGHSGATFNQFKKASEKGLRGAVHLMNGPIKSSYKPFHGGGAFEAALSLDPVFVELIPDYVHVSKGYLLDAIRRKGPDRVLAITDSMFVTGLPDVRHFHISGIRGEVSKGGNYLQVSGHPDTLFGSILTMKKAFENLLSLQTVSHAGIWNREHPAQPFETAVYRTLHMCAFTPLNYLNLRSQNAPPELMPGMDADLLLCDISGDSGDYTLSINTVFLSGEAVD